MPTENQKMAKKSIGNLMRKRLSDITNSSHSSQQENHNNYNTLSLDNDSIQQLLKERANLINLLADRNLNSKMIERSGAELQRLRADMKKLQMQNWNLAQSNSLMLAELNLGRDKIKTLQHELLWRAALINGNTFKMQEKVEIDTEKNAPLSELQEGDEKEVQQSPRVSNDDEKQCCLNRRRVRSRSIGSSTASRKNKSKEKVKDNRRSLRRHSAASKVHVHEPLENLFEIEDAQYAITQSGHNKLSTPSVKTERRKSSGLRNEAARHSFGRPLRRAAEKVPSYKEAPLNVKMRRLA